MDEKPVHQRSEYNRLGLYDDFLAHTPVDRLQKILARYELFKKIVEVPGDLVECGVFKGSGLYTLGKLYKLFLSHSDRKIIGFDFFETDQNIELTRDSDQKVLDVHTHNIVTRETMLANLKNFGVDNVELIPGNVVETTKKYVENNLGFRIALLYLDVDNYEGTIGILNNLFPLVSPGGIVIFDEYAIRSHGESDAIDEYFKGSNLKLQTLPWAKTPSSFLIKEKD